MTEKCDVFNDDLDNEDCRGILLNYLTNLEKEVNYIKSLVDQNRQTQIKGEQALADLSNLLQICLMNVRKNARKKIEIIKKLNEKVSALTERSKALEGNI